MDAKIKIYRDTGANINFLKPFLSKIDLYQYPYDSPDRPQKPKMILGKPSNLTWKDFHSAWAESNFTWSKCVGSGSYDEILKTIGKGNRRDALHYDTAHKNCCTVFLTSDKTDLYSKKKELEKITGIKVFFHGDEDQILDYISSQLKTDHYSPC